MSDNVTHSGVPRYPGPGYPHRCFLGGLAPLSAPNWGPPSAGYRAPPVEPLTPPARTLSRCSRPPSFSLDIDT